MEKSNILELVMKELNRESEVINLIASEAPLPLLVRNILGSALHQKYAEGYPGRRYYNGCKVIDEIESKTIEEVSKCFGTKFANVQPHSGTTANQAVWKAARSILAEKGHNKTIPTLSMSLDAGGHLSHFSKPAYKTDEYERTYYGLKDDGSFNWDQIESWIENNEFGIIVIGCSSYPETVDYEKFSEIIRNHTERDYVICFDISHIAGLICGKQVIHPFFYNWGNASLVITSTTHKTWGGVRHAVICWNDEKLSKHINHAVFPEMQGGANFAIVAAVGAWAEWINNNMTEYSAMQKEIIENTEKLSEPLKDKLVFSTGHNHIALVRCRDKKHAQAVADELEKSKIIVNINGLYDGGYGLRISASYETLKNSSISWRQIGEYIKYLIENVE